MDLLSCENVGLEICKKIYQKYTNLTLMNWVFFKWVILDWMSFLIWLEEYMQLYKMEVDEIAWLQIEWKNCHLSDKHEHEENVQYQKEFIKKYFTLQKRSCRWKVKAASNSTASARNAGLDLLVKWSSYISKQSCTHICRTCYHSRLI